MALGLPDAAENGCRHDDRTARRRLVQRSCTVRRGNAGTIGRHADGWCSAWAHCAQVNAGTIGRYADGWCSARAHRAQVIHASGVVRAVGLGGLRAGSQVQPMIVPRSGVLGLKSPGPGVAMSKPVLRGCLPGINTARWSSLSGKSARWRRQEATRSRDFPRPRANLGADCGCTHQTAAPARPSEGRVDDSGAKLARDSIAQRAARSNIACPTRSSASLARARTS
jgi:hypothetical protein